MVCGSGPLLSAMETKDLTIKEYIDLVYDNFKDKKWRLDDLTNDEMVKWLLLDSKNIITNVIYHNHKRENDLRDENIKKLFKNICILAKINDINLVD